MKTVLPAEASAKMDFRLVPDQRPRDVFDKLRAHLDDQGFADVEIVLMGRGQSGANRHRFAVGTTGRSDGRGDIRPQAGYSAQHARHRPVVRLRRNAWNPHLDERGRSPLP